MFSLATMTTAEVLRACAEQAKLPFLLIGGHAVILHGYQRNTADLDVLIRRTDLDAWVGALAKVNYRPDYVQRTFTRFRSSAGAIDLDVMLVSDETFRGLERFQAAAAGRGVEPAALAIAWVLSHPQVTAVVVGPRRPEQLEPAVAALELRLSPQERDELAELFA